MITPTTTRYPKVTIQYCSKCKWQNRAVWYLQELLQTFDGIIQDISLQPIAEQPGIFQVLVAQSENDEETVIYKRRFKSVELALKYGDKDGTQSESYYYDGFPDSKFLKSLIRDFLGDKRKLDHIDKYTSGNFLNQSDKECAACEREDTCDRIP